MGRRAGILASVPVLALVFVAPAGGERIAVTTTLDEFGGPGSTGCALREAAQAANTNQNFGGCKRKGSGKLDIIKPAGGQLYQDGRAGEDDTNETGDLDITGKTAIEVRGEGRATLDGNNLDRVLDVLQGAKLTASRLTIQNGAVQTPGPGGHDGGGIRNAGRLVLRASSLTSNQVPNDLNNDGGGIATIDGARLTSLTRVAVTGNVAPLGDGGGIFFSDGDLVVSRSTIAGNDALDGAGLALLGEGEVRINTSTIANNDASGESTGGGGIFVSSASLGDMRATNVTISGNTSNTRGGGIYDEGGGLSLNAATVTGNTADLNGDGGTTAGGSGGGFNGGTDYRNSIVVGNTATNGAAADCAESGSTSSRSLIGIGTGCSEFGTNIATAAPMIGPIADNGGPTETHELLANSPAINKAGRKSSPPKDQRGEPRGRKPDIGAYER
jgi:CSLREA domain-containing protein